MQPKDQRRDSPDYTVIPRVLIFLTNTKRVLLLRGASDKRLWANQYNGWGGHVEAGETPYQAALREVHEEAGVTVDTLVLRAIVHITMPQPPGVMMFVFVGELADSTPLRASQEGAPEWINRADLMTLPLVEDLPQLLPRVLDAGPLVFGQYVITENGLHIQLT